MITLSKGYKKPQYPDTGDVWFPAMEQNIQLMNDHTHDGSNSQVLGSATQVIASGSWVASPIGGGSYRQLVTMPAGFSFDQCALWFQLSTGEVVYPSVERQSSTTYYIYTNDNTKTYKAFYR